MTLTLTDLFCGAGGSSTGAIGPEPREGHGEQRVPAERP